MMIADDSRISRTGINSGYMVRLIVYTLPQQIYLLCKRSFGVSPEWLLPPPGLLARLKQLQPLPIHIRHRFRIMGNDDVLADPRRCPALFNHLVDLIVDPIPIFTISFSVE